MSPYRTPPPRDEPPRATRANEEPILYGAVLLTGAIPVTGVIVTGTEFGAEATLGLSLVVSGVVGLVRWCCSPQGQR